MVLLVKEGPPPTSRGAAEKLVCGPLCSQVPALESQREAIWGFVLSLNRAVTGKLISCKNRRREAERQRILGLED